MRRAYTLGLAFFMLLCLQLTPAWAQLDYYFMESSGEPIIPESSFLIWDGYWGAYGDYYTFNTPFPIKFNGGSYPYLTISTNGVVYPSTNGDVYPYDYYNSLSGAYSYPVFAPFWDDIFVGYGYYGCSSPTVSYGVTGTSPNRVLVIDYTDVAPFETVYYYMEQPALSFQIRLYENSGKVEYFYKRMENCSVCPGSSMCFTTSASIGIAASSSDFISVGIQGGQAVASTSTPDDNVDIDGGAIDAGTLYTFAECSPVISGRIGESNGGTPNAADGDTFFTGTTVQIGQSVDLKPIAVAMAAVACQSNFSMTITGPAAADYYFGSPGTQSVSGSLAGGVIQIPAITFRPTAPGNRTARLTVTVASTTRSYTLNAYAPFVSYTGNVPEGGTSLMKNGDILLAGQRVDRRTTRTFQPFTLTNVGSAAVPVSYEISGGSGQYTITPGGSLAAGASATPTITFNAIGFGPQNATLTVTAGSEVRTFTLRAISAAPGGEFRMNTSLVDTSSSLFNNVYGCTGGNGEMVEINMVNTGYGPFTFTNAEFYRIDTTIGPGTPPFAFIRDMQGSLIPSSDYTLSLTPNGPPVQPFTLQERESRTLYLRFTSQAPGKRYARAYFYTNSENTAAPDINGVMREGILAFNVFGRGSGARLSDRVQGGLPRAIIFNAVKIGSSVESSLRIVNTGTCSLSVSMNDLAITSGDVDEFEIISRPSNLLLGPGESREIGIRFTPRQAGSRRASLRLVTNDSTIQIPGITERGTYYVDLFGGGGTDLYANGHNFGPALIDGTGPDRKNGVVRIVNTLPAPVTVNSITIEGTDAAQFMEDPAKPWPARPMMLQPGEEVTLGVVFAPTGDPGSRSAEIRLDLVGGVTVTAPLTGEAGTRMATANRNTLVFGSTTVGRFQRNMVSITNTGTMPVRLEQPEITGPDRDLFSVGKMDRLELAPGQTEQVEVTFSPVVPGPSEALLVFNGNMTNGPVQINLGGASKTKAPNDPNVAVTGRDGIIENGVGINSGIENYSTSSVGTVKSPNGMTLGQSAPNPAQQNVEIRYTLAKAGKVSLVLFDAQGREVRVLDAGQRATGERALTVNVSDLANGTYMYRLTVGGETLIRQMTVAR